MLDRILSASVALSLAILVWLYARSRDQETLDDIPVPVHITLPREQADHYSVEVTGASQVAVSFSGPPSRLRELQGILQRGEFRVEVTLTVPEDRQNESHYLDTVHVESTDLHPPHGVVARLLEERNRIPVTLHRLVERPLPVHFDRSFEDQLGVVTIEPKSVLVRGPQEIIERARAISTVPYPLSVPLDRAENTGEVVFGPVPLVQELEGRPIQATPPAVQLRLSVQPRRKVYELDVPIRFLIPEKFTLRPKLLGNERSGRLTLRVEGPASGEPPAVYAFIDLTRPSLQKGFNDEPVRIQLPRDYQLAQDPPRSLGVELEPLDAPSKLAGGLAGP
jgi:hypothetical protein